MLAPLTTMVCFLVAALALSLPVNVVAFHVITALFNYAFFFLFIW